MSYDPLDHDLARGLHNRRTILGDAWVDASLGNANSFNADFQQFITRFAWHEIWGRPGLEHKTRRAIVLAICTALGRWEEFDLHTRAALLGDDSSKLTPDEIKEILMQSAIYAGVPAANTAFTHALKILRDVGPDIGYSVDPRSPTACCHPGAGQEGRTASAPALHYSVRAPRNGKAPRHTVVLSHALGCDLTMWDGLATQLATDCRVIAYDHRGHGSSDSGPAMPTMANLADDAARLLRELDSGPVVWIGLSMGGMVGQELALRHPSLVRALVLANTAAAYPEAVKAMWEQRIAAVTSDGISAIADAVMGRYFHEGFRQQHSAVVARFRERLVSTDAAGYIACCHAISGIDTVERLSNIKIPALVIAGELDLGTPVAMASALADGIPGARLRVIEAASHLSAVEQAPHFEAAVLDFLSGL